MTSSLKLFTYSYDYSLMFSVKQIYDSSSIYVNYLGSSIVLSSISIYLLNIFYKSSITILNIDYRFVLNI